MSEHMESTAELIEHLSLLKGWSLEETWECHQLTLAEAEARAKQLEELEKPLRVRKALRDALRGS